MFGQQKANPQNIGALNLSPQVNVVQGTEIALLSPDQNGRNLIVFSADVDGWLIKPGDYRAKTFTADNTTNELTITDHGYLTGDGPYRLTTAGTFPAGLDGNTDYYIIVVDTNTIQLATSFGDAIQGIAVSFTDDGTGTHTIGGMPAAEHPADDVTDGTDAFFLAQGQRIVAHLARSYTVVSFGVGPAVLRWYTI